MSYAVVEFIAKGTIEVVSSNWLLIEKGSKIGACFRPPNDVEEQAKGQKPPDKEKWDFHRVRLLLYYDLFDEARRSACNATITPDLGSTTCKQEKQEIRELQAPNTDCSLFPDENDQPGNGKAAKKINSVQKRKRVDLIQIHNSIEASDNPLISTTTPIFGSAHQQKRMRTTSDDSLENWSNANRHGEGSSSMPLLDGTHSMESNVSISDQPYFTTLQATLHLLYEGQQEQTRLLQQILSRMTGGREFEEDHMFCVPLQDITELDTVAEKLENDKNYRSQVLFHLSRVGGRNTGDTVRNIMARVGTPSLWSHFSFMGQRGNQPFRGNPLCNAIIRACMQGNDVKEKDVEIAISDVLRYSKKKKTSKT